MPIYLTSLKNLEKKPHCSLCTRCESLLGGMIIALVTSGILEKKELGMGRGIVRLFVLNIAVLVGLFSPQSGKASTVVLVTPFQKQASAINEYKQSVGEVVHKVILTDENLVPADASVDVVAELRSAKSRIRLVCFDRAAADCLMALINFPHLQKNVESLVSLQGKVLGAESSEGLIDPSGEQLYKAQKMPLMGACRFLARFLWAYLFPKARGAYAMNPLVRQPYIESLRPQLKKLSQKVKILSIDRSDSKYGVIPFSHKIQLSQVEKKSNP